MTSPAPPPPPSSMLTPRERLALYVAAVCAALTFTIALSMLHPCRQPNPPTHPVPADM